MYQNKVVEKIKTHILCLVTFLHKLVPFTRKCGKINQDFCDCKTDKCPSYDDAMKSSYSWRNMYHLTRY